MIMMDQAVIKYYRMLLRGGFANAGTIEESSIFLDPVAEGERRICGRPADYMKIYIDIRGGRITEMKYLCLCDPTANVAIEVMCGILKGKALDEAASIGPEAIMGKVGSSGEELRTKATALVELIKKGIIRYRDHREVHASDFI